MAFATLHDVAEAAGVSYATVDRVVNARGGVSQKSVLRVQAAIKQLGYARDVSAANLARKRVYRFLFLLPEDHNDFFHSLYSALQSHAQRPNLLRIAVTTTRLPAFSEKALIEALARIDPATVDCACVVALDTPAVNAAVQRVRAQGVKLVTLVSDIDAASRDAYVGIDNYVAGKTAGRMMGLCHGRQPGLVLPIIGTSRAHDHIQRLSGFLEIMQAHFPQITLLEPVTSRDEAATIHRELDDIWRAHPNLTGVYNMGAGNDGLVAWIRGITGRDRPFMVIHELLPNARTALEAGLVDAVIDQKPKEIITRTMDAMRLLVDGEALPTPAPVITPAIYLCENLPDTPKETDWMPSND
ncbi:LacI family DNA-binding transcriptional regulator [Yoonia sediminilitoris]|uniref:LacI family transcriptional regulator n=1 Tax=Yoonia sediminilitoris TaxID=1286148 RepID=A0A2T6KAF4_9RHOB|nr:LacI family DNA-binding transcriptional regulator [Yoonia sediminilitoris]PUB11821.1 LacI family transcriptional regulator [Yoonia sediminilitoris]RCW91898.1 LacI family transcriptional regulator [Yoonia sediminilitoris]